MTRMVQYLSMLIMVFLLISVPVDVAPQEPEPEEPTQDEEAASTSEDDEDEERGGRNGRDREGIQPYDEVVTDEAVSDDGIFTVHRVDEDYYYEIPAAELENEFL